MNFKMSIVVRTQFEAMHRWPEAPAEVFFLRDYHRHLFKVEAKLRVNDPNRQLEFFMVKRELDKFVMLKWQGSATDNSCEAMAHSMLGFLEHTYGEIVEYVSVFEDGENGAIVEAE